MNPALLKALVALLPTCMLFCGSIILFFRGRAVFSVLQVVGAGGLVVVVLSHICEALHVFPWMHWGLEDSAGHYLDLSSAVLAFTLFPTGYLLHALKDSAASFARNVDPAPACDAGMLTDSVPNRQPGIISRTAA